MGSQPTFYALRANGPFPSPRVIRVRDTTGPPDTAQGYGTTALVLPHRSGRRAPVRSRATDPLPLVRGRVREGDGCAREGSEAPPRPKAKRVPSPLGGEG